MDDNHPLESLLRELPARPSPAFTDEVMKRVADVPQVRAPLSPWVFAESELALSWWTRAILQPATILALILAALTGELLLLAGGAGELTRTLLAWISALPSLTMLPRVVTVVAPILLSIAGSVLVAVLSYRWAPTLLPRRNP